MKLQTESKLSKGQAHIVVAVALFLVATGIIIAQNETIINIIENATQETQPAANETVPLLPAPEQTSNETANETIPIETLPAINWTVPKNETINATSPINETINQTIPLPAPVPVPEPQPVPVPEPAIPTGLNIDVSYPSRITRGELLEIIANITNAGSSDAQIAVNWILPSGFEIVSKQDCTFVAAGSSCISSVTVKTLLSASLGRNSIKVVVRYG